MFGFLVFCFFLFDRTQPILIFRVNQDLYYETYVCVVWVVEMVEVCFMKYQKPKVFITNKLLNYFFYKTCVYLKT